MRRCPESSLSPFQGSKIWVGPASPGLTPWARSLPALRAQEGKGRLLAVRPSFPAVGKSGRRSRLYNFSPALYRNDTDEGWAASQEGYPPARLYGFAPELYRSAFSPPWATARLYRNLGELYRPALHQPWADPGIYRPEEKLYSRRPAQASRVSGRRSPEPEKTFLWPLFGENQRRPSIQQPPRTRVPW
jgi:hypothetical protein